MIGRLVHESQRVFIRSGNIFEGWTIASKVMETMSHTVYECIFKIDFEKAYHCLKWDFLDLVLGKM